MKLRLLVLLVANLSCYATQAFAATPPAEPSPFASHWPLRYEAISSVVMQYRWFKFPTLGVMSVDARKGDFALVGLSQIGINVFELSEKNGVVKSHMPGKLLERSPQIANGAAADVRNMFFDLSPPTPGAGEAAPGNQVIFRRTAPGGTLEYRFDNSTKRLLEKRFAVPRGYFFGSSVVWLVRYEDYVTSGKYTYPRVVHFKNRKYNYAITTIVKEMRIK